MPRLLKLKDEALVKKLLRAISMGQPFKRACPYAGVSYKTFCIWRQQAQKDRDAGEDTIYTRFAFKVEQSTAEMEFRCLARIETGKTGWQGAAWKLERKWPENYAAPQRIQITGKGEGPLQVVSGPEALAVYQAALDRAEKKTGAESS